ncbi:MAG: hypothetical protein ACQESK_04340 [Bacteroidota bacterium]
MNKLRVTIILLILLSFSACKTAKQICLDRYNCYHKTNKEKTKYCNYFGSSSTVTTYKKYLKKADGIKDQLIVIENSDWFQGKYFGKEYIFFKDGKFDKMIRADKGNFFTRKIKDYSDIFLADKKSAEKIKFYLIALEHLQEIPQEHKECSIELTEEIFEEINKRLAQESEDKVYFSGINGNSTISIFDDNLKLIKQYYSSRVAISLDIIPSK